MIEHYSLLSHHIRKLHNIYINYKIIIQYTGKKQSKMMCYENT